MHHPYVRKNKKVLLDTNLLTMYIVSRIGAGEVENFKRTRAYTSKDAEILDDVLKNFESIVTTPHILAETANILDWFDKSKRATVLGFLSKYIELVEEVHYPAANITLSPAFLKLGLSDAALFDLSVSNKYVLLTDDLDLYGFAAGHNIEALNFTHFRNYL
ncbi:PIN domain-containing protein [Psychrobacter raelei]|uniref:PIN domain-containing protein n=1 Tax=Psychrobacter raelei TaxID=2565531 RepID=A0AAT9PFL1_9GAMM|nr:PIN domain-containing protein [Psychrobacter sp. PraFG1]UNK06361.1 hypothetical protein MN210_07470 [Psychrobacter sp. PraFG1]